MTVVAKGDTLWGYAKQILGPKAKAKDISAMADQIAADHKIADKKTIKIGQTIDLTKYAKNSSLPKPSNLSCSVFTQQATSTQECSAPEGLYTPKVGCVFGGSEVKEKLSSEPLS